MCEYGTAAISTFTSKNPTLRTREYMPFISIFTQECSSQVAELKTLGLA